MDMSGKGLCASAALALAVWAGPARGVDFRWGALGGYNHGLGARGEVVALHLSRDLPLGIGFGLGYTRLDPGHAGDARRIFINDATDGTPEKEGWFLDFRLDALWYVHAGRLQNAALFAGVRRDVFRGRFRFVGGNEDFTIEADDWGFGLGARGEVKLGRQLSLLGSIGFDYYPWSSLYGHDTRYSSDGSEDNGREGYAWRDADRAVNQPRFVPSVMLGLAW